MLCFGLVHNMSDHDTIYDTIKDQDKKYGLWRDTLRFSRLFKWIYEDFFKVCLIVRSCFEFVSFQEAALVGCLVCALQYFCE